jgi:hypothetical protein
MHTVSEKPALQCLIKNNAPLNFNSLNYRVKDTIQMSCRLCSVEQYHLVRYASNRYKCFIQLKTASSQLSPNNTLLDVF